MSRPPAANNRVAIELALLFAGGMLLNAGAAAARAQTRAATPSGNSANGKTLFVSKTCNQCHGAAAEGSAAGPKLAGDPIGFEAFVAQVRTPTDKMPPQTAAMVSDAQLADIYAYLHTLAGAAPPAAAISSMGPGNAQNGARIFEAYGCYECHGHAAQGASTGPRLGPNPISVEAMIHELRHPNEMPPFTERVVSDAEINDIHAFLASLPQPPKPDSLPLLSR